MPGRPNVLSAKPVLINTAKTLACVYAAWLLTGCAAQIAYRDGKQFIAQDKIEAGLSKFQEAIKQDPRNTEYKAAFLQTRERWIAGFLEQADRLTASGNPEEAQAFYQRVLAIEATNERALAGLRTLTMRQRHAQLLQEAQAALDKKDTESAKSKLATILTEAPENEPARALQRAIEDKAAKPHGETFLASAYKKSITLEFRDATLRQIFEVIARTSGLNFLFDKDVKTDQRTSIFLKNSTIESAVHFALLTNQLEQQVLDANTVLIYPNTTAKQKDYQEMIVKSFFLTNADAKTVANTLKTILKSRDVVVDEKLNMLIVRDNADAIKLAEKLVTLHDVPEPEVMLEVEILEIKRTRLLDLGIKWPTNLSLTPLPSSLGNTLTLRDLRSNLNGNTIGVAIPSTLINANKQDSDTNILANPRIRARNHEKAKILIGERVPNITTTTSPTAISNFVSESITYIDIGLKLDVEPTIYLNNDVAIKISLEVSNIVNQIQTKSGSTAYQIGTRTASTVLRLKDGENQVLAGLINDEDRRNGNKLPGLGELPLVGRLFGSAIDDNQKTEIVLSITPHLVRNIQRPEATQAEFRAGTDSSFRVRPDILSASGSASAALAPRSNNNSLSNPRRTPGPGANGTYPPPVPTPQNHEAPAAQ